MRSLKNAGGRHSLVWPQNDAVEVRVRGTAEERQSRGISVCRDIWWENQPSAAKYHILVSTPAEGVGFHLAMSCLSASCRAKMRRIGGAEGVTFQQQ